MLDQQTHIAVGQGPFPADGAGVPLNKDGRAALLAYNAETLEQLQRQCHPWSVNYLIFGPFGMQIKTNTDALTGQAVALRIAGAIDRMPTTI